jgi:UDP-N-acetylglucosamine acyltransferase
MPEAREGATFVHPTALVAPGAQLHPGARVGPFCVVEGDVVIGPDCILEPNVVLKSGTRMGSRNHIHTGAVIGEPPQDLKYHGESTEIIIGEDNLIREYVTLHRATGEGEATLIGDHNLIMAYCHLGHNCEIGSHIQMANFAGLAGHVKVEDRAVLGAICGVHQYVRVGTLAMLGGYSKIVQDCPPYCMVDGRRASVVALNFRGLRRAGLDENARRALRSAFRLLFRSDYNTTEALERLEQEVEQTPEVRHLAEFMRAFGQGYAGRADDPLGRRCRGEN